MPIKRTTGEYITLSTKEESFQAFVPSPLPVRPPLELHHLATQISEATLTFDRLDGLVSHLPDVKLLLYSYVRRSC